MSENKGELNLETLQLETDRLKAHFDEIDKEREDAYGKARELRRAGVQAVRDIQKGKRKAAREAIAASRDMAVELTNCTKPFGFVEEALQEYAEAAFTLAFIEKGAIPTQEEIGVNERAYLSGLSDTVGELRRHILDLMRKDNLEEAQNYLNVMDEIFSLLIRFDHTDAVLPLRKKVDQNRGIIERTRGDVTAVICQKRLERSLAAAEGQGAGSGA